MIFCPNKNLPEWKELVNRLGDEDLAYFEWNRKYGDFNQAPVKTIKNGVPELFDSNPELANQVYEALGFTKKNEVEIIENKIITAGKTWLINEFEKNSEISKFLKSRDKKKFEDFGVESIYDMPKDDIIYYLSLVAQEFAGGVGQIFTFNSIDDIYNKNNPRSSYDEALKVRNFFKEKFNIPKDLVEGIDSKKEESILNLLGYRVSEKPVNGKYRVTLKRDFTSFYDEFSTKEEAKAKANELNKNILSERLGTQITPQQKQQALQQYSQYLDTIFPESKVKDIVYHGTKGKKFDKFISSETGEFGRGVYFGNYQTALENTDKLDDFTLEPITGFDKNKIIPAVINTQNIYKRDLGGNGIRNEYVVEPEQIHILGSQKDIKGFKEFADKVNETDVALEHQDSFTMEELSAMMYENTEIDFNTEELIDSPIDKLYNAYSETFSENQISKEKLEELLSKGVPVNSIEEWTKSCLIGGGKGVPKAKDGMSFNFTPGGTWKLIKDLQGYPTHEKGGVDLYIGKNGVNLARGESSIMAEKGLVLPKAQSESTSVNMPIMQGGGVIKNNPNNTDNEAPSFDYSNTVMPRDNTNVVIPQENYDDLLKQYLKAETEEYERFKNSLPDNLKYTDESNYDMRYLWIHGGKPKSFEESINSENPMFSLEKDGLYHGPSVEPNTLQFVKRYDHPTLQKELNWYYSKEGEKFRREYDLVKEGEFYRYVLRKKQKS